jgi:nucleoside-diphosphate-sugar epimerase
MILGNGMIAKAIESQMGNGTDLLIVAAGVSDSSETRSSAFIKEEKLLLNNVPLFNQVVYFSSCALANAELRSPYYDHKRRMEHLVKENSKSYTIVRLPQVIGRTKNNSTFINAFVNDINNGRTLTVWENAYRYVIDIEDAAFLLDIALTSGHFNNQTVNFAHPESYKVSEIVKAMFKILDRSVPVVMKPKTDFYSLDLRPMLELNRRLTNPIVFDSSYLEARLRKYYTRCR